MKETLERQLYTLLKEKLDGDIEYLGRGIHIVEVEDAVESGGWGSVKVFTSEGHGFKLECVAHEYYEDSPEYLNEGGYVYLFCDPWDGFLEVSCEEALEIVRTYLS